MTYLKSTQAYLKNRRRENKKTIYKFKIALVVLLLALLGIFITTLFETASIDLFLNSNTDNFKQIIFFYILLYILAFGFCIYKIKKLEKQNKHITKRLLEADQ